MNILFCIIFFFCCQPCDPLQPEDQAVLDRFFEYAGKHQLSRLSFQERIVKTGEFFLNTPYRGGTLEGKEKEQLVVNLRQLDCVTFVDNVMALALLKQYDAEACKEFLSNLQKIRYRDRKILNYTSRLHYSTDWLYEMQRIGLVSDVTKSNGGIPFPNKVGFISLNYRKYPALTKDTVLLPEISRIEKNINARNYFYIPKNQVNEKAGQIQNGDIILITTNKKGLDTSHVGIAVEKDGNIYLLHASLTSRKVILSDIPLSHYLSQIPSHTGIMIARPLNVNLN